MVLSVAVAAGASDEQRRGGGIFEETSGVLERKGGAGPEVLPAFGVTGEG